MDIVHIEDAQDLIQMGESMNKELDFSFDIVGFGTTENGDYTNMVASNGFTLQFQDNDGNVIPLNKEAIEKFLRG